MDRRTAMASCAAAVLASLAACGGGGSVPTPVAVATTDPPSPSPAPAPAPASSPSPAPSAAPQSPQSANVACWGDSLTPAFALNLQVLVPDRTVFDGGFLGQTSTFISAQQLADTSMTSWINVFWWGHNNDHDPVTILADFAASIAHLAPGNRHFIVLSMLNEARVDEIAGTDEYSTIVKMNDQLAQLYPDNYIDVRAMLVAHYDPSNPQDVIDHANDVPPSSLRYDSIHLRNEGSVLVAQSVAQFIADKGW